MRIRSLEELTTTDEGTRRFTSFGLATGGMLSPEDSARLQQEAIGGADLHDDVAEGTRSGFERLRTVHSYGVFFYDAFTVADDLAWLLLEQAYRERFVSFYDGEVSFINELTGDSMNVVATDFGTVYDAVKSQKGKGWRLVMSTGKTLHFRGSFEHLQTWGRREGLLDGQRNKRLDPVYRSMRNSVTHPHSHLNMPPDSARTIRDLAEIINRLWGHLTPGGRLYPGPLWRDVCVVAWREDGTGMTRCDPSVLGDLAPAGYETCVLVLRVRDDEHLWDFDADVEETSYPTDLLWGPGTPKDAATWLSQNAPTGDHIEHLDRLFAVRIRHGKVSMPRRPEKVLGLPTELRDGEWLVLRADFPSDAFAHARHVRDGISCRTAELYGGCPVEDVAAGNWQTVAERLADDHVVGVPPALVRVPRRLALPDEIEAT
jgi:hypothetical protein